MATTTPHTPSSATTPTPMSRPFFDEPWGCGGTWLKPGC
jgi:hypothetical protein